MSPKFILSIVAGVLAVLAMLSIANPFALPIAVLLLAVCNFI